MLRDESTISVASGKVQVEMTSTHDITNSIVKGNGLDIPARSPTSTSTPFSTRPDSDAGSPSSSTHQYSLKRTGSNIASLRAAFEHTDAANTPVRRFEKSPSRSFSGHSENISNRGCEKDAEIARLEMLLADEIEKRQSSQSQLRASQERCERLEKESRRSDAIQSDNVEDEETKSVQRQLYELKRSISTATRIENQVSDSTFAQEFANLHHELQNFIVNSFRRVKITKTPQELCDILERVAASKQREYLQPLFIAFEPSMKLAALQATAVCYIMEVFDEPLLFGLPNQQEWRENLRKTMETLPAILAPSTFNKWRYLTLDAVRQSVGIEELVHSAAGRLTETMCATLSALTDVEDMSARASSLNSIIVRAVHLSHLFRVQRAHYEFALPVPGAPFQPDLMEDHTFDLEALAERTAVCATFPSIVKHGGENWDDTQLSNVLVKAKVLCNA